MKLSKQHIPSLDGIRALAILMVVCFHYWGIFAGVDKQHLAGKLAAWGQTGVTLFFVLSGFLITGILLDGQGSEHLLKNFFARRILRIFPLYYAALFALYVVGPLVHLAPWVPFDKCFWYLTYLQNIPATFNQSLASGPGHFWSLAVEEHYYLFWPFAVSWLTRNALVRTIAAMVGISILTRAILILNGYESFYFTFSNLDSLAIGSYVAILARDPAGLSRFVRPAKWLMLTVGLVVAVAQLKLAGTGLPLLPILKNTLVSLVFACFLLLVLERALGSTVQRTLGSGFLGSIGKYSYSMYITHVFVITMLFRAGLKLGSASFILALVLPYCLAWITWRVLEQPFLRLKRNFDYSQPESAVLSVSQTA